MCTQVSGRNNESRNHLQARGFQANGVLRSQLALKNNDNRPPPTLISFERPGQFQVGAVRTDSTIDYGDRSRDRRTDTEKGGVLLQHDEKAGIRRALRQRTNVHRQHLYSSHDRGNQTNAPRVEHVALRFFFIQEQVKEESASTSSRLKINLKHTPGH